MSVKNEDGLVDLICRSDSGKEAIVYLQDQWADLPIEPNTRIRLIGAQPWGDSDWLVSSEQGILIVAPDTLVPSTAIARSTWCPRKVVLNERFRGQAQANKAMLIGVIMHELFQAALRCPNPRMVTTEWLLGKWQDGLYDEVITQLAALRFTPSQFETELAPYADVIVDWVQTHLPAERVTSLGKDWHRPCLRCANDSCKKTLSPGSHAEHEGKPYCKQCYGALFGPKGYGHGGTESHTFHGGATG